MGAGDVGYYKHLPSMHTALGSVLSTTTKKSSSHGRIQHIYLPFKTLNFKPTVVAALLITQGNASRFGHEAPYSKSNIIPEPEHIYSPSSLACSGHMFGVVAHQHKLLFCSQPPGILTVDKGVPA